MNERASIIDYIEEQADNHDAKGDHPRDGMVHRRAATRLRALAADVRAHLDHPSGGAVQRSIVESLAHDGESHRQVVALLRCTLECGHVVEIAQPKRDRKKEWVWCEECAAGS